MIQNTPNSGMHRRRFFAVANILISGVFMLPFTVNAQAAVRNERSGDPGGKPKTAPVPSYPAPTDVWLYLSGST